VTVGTVVGLMLRRFTVVALCLLAVTGCREAERAGTATSTVTAAVPAEVVVSDLYKRHSSGDSPFFQTENRGKVDLYFEPALADLIWKDAVTSNGEVGALEFDPLYYAQDTDIRNFVIHPAEVEGGGARVVVTFDNLGTAERLTYMLVQAGGHWRIADIAYGGGTTLRGILSVPAGAS